MHMHACVYMWNNACRLPQVKETGEKIEQRHLHEIMQTGPGKNEGIKLSLYDRQHLTRVIILSCF